MKTTATWLTIATVSACSSGSSNPVSLVTFDPNLDAVVADGELTVISDGRTITVPLREDGVTDGFEGGQLFGETDFTAAHFASADATATIATELNDEFFIVTSFERLNAVETPLTGTATAVGTGVSVFTVHEPIELGDNDPFALNSSIPIQVQVSETITLNVNFDEDTIDGQIVSDTVSLFGLDGFVLSDEINTIDLLETQIDSDGDFEGVAQFANNPEVDAGTYSGLVAGSDGDTFVGAFELPGRTGVFQATTR